MSYTKSFGAILSPIDVRDYKIARAVLAEEFPETFELKMPEVKNQKDVGSCVAHAIATTIEYFSRLQGDDDRDMSVGYIYGNRTTSTYEGIGMIVRDALEAARKYGDVARLLFPYNTEVPEVINLFEHHFIKLAPDAYPNKITSYYRIYNENEIKAALMKHGPVIFAMEWYEDIMIVNGIMKTKQESSSTNGHHCMVIYGWNQDGWLIQNSWGARWANDGRAVIPYNVEFNEMWGIIDEYSENLKQAELNRLYTTNAELEEKIIKLTNEANEYLERINALHESIDIADEEYRRKSVKMRDEMLKRAEEIKQARDTIAQQKEEIKRLEAVNLELKKPFSSAIGKIIAKFINFVVNKFKK